MKVNDGTSDSAVQDVRFTITGANDAPVLSDTTNPTAIVELANATAQDLAAITGSFAVSDLDVGDTLTASVVGSPVVQLGGANFTLPAGAAALIAGSAFTLSPTTQTSVGGAGTAIGYTYNPAAANLDFLAAGQTLTITYQVKVNDGTADSTVQDVTFTITGTNDAPVVTDQSARVSEEGLVGGIADGVAASGSLDLASSSTVNGTMVSTDVDGPARTWTFTSAPTGITSNGVAVVWTLVGQTYTGKAGTVDVATISLTSTGDYTFNLQAPIDQLGAGEDERSLNFGVSASDGSLSGAGTLTVIVEDDAPVTAATSNNIYVGVDTLSVNTLRAGFINARLDNGNAVTAVEGTTPDADALGEVLTWGTGTTPSGYTLVDNTSYTSGAGTGVALNQLFQVGTFTHNNFPISGSPLNFTDLTMSFNVVINGIVTNVPFTIRLDHTETSNTSTPTDDASRDIITLPSSASTINIAGQNYVVNLNGFKDSSGNLVTQIFTREQQASTFGIFASITTVEPLPTASGSVFAQGGADGINASGVVWSGTSSYGTFVGNANGTYTFTMNEATRGSMTIGQQLTASFNYTVTDKDGDVSTNVLTINLSGYQNLEGTAAGNNLVGNNTNGDIIFGYGDNDTINGQGGNDVIIGGTGNDSLTGGLGADTFKWGLNDNGSIATPAVDRIIGFDTTAFGSGGDRLDLRDLLVGENSSTLDKFLHFNFDGTNTTLYISTSGAFTAGNAVATNLTNVTDNDVQQIVFAGVNLTGSFTTDMQLINDLIAKGKIITD